MLAKRLATLIGLNLFSLGLTGWAVAWALAAPPFGENPARSAAAENVVSEVTAAPPGPSLAQPLFAASRKAPARPQDTAAQTPLPEAPQLVGILSTGARSRTALLEKNSERRLVKAGESFEGWTITRIDRASVTVSTPTSAGTEHVQTIPLQSNIASSTTAP